MSADAEKSVPPSHYYRANLDRMIAERNAEIALQKDPLRVAAMLGYVADLYIIKAKARLSDGYGEGIEHNVAYALRKRFYMMAAYGNNSQDWVLHIMANNRNKTEDVVENTLALLKRLPENSREVLSKEVERLTQGLKVANIKMAKAFLGGRQQLIDSILEDVTEAKLTLSRPHYTLSEEEIRQTIKPLVSDVHEYLSQARATTQSAIDIFQNELRRGKQK